MLFDLEGKNQESVRGEAFYVSPLPIFLSDSICSVQIEVASVKNALVMYSPWAVFESTTAHLVASKELPRMAAIGSVVVQG